MDLPTSVAALCLGIGLIVWQQLGGRSAAALGTWRALLVCGLGVFIGLFGIMKGTAGSSAVPFFFFAAFAAYLLGVFATLGGDALRQVYLAISTGPKREHVVPIVFDVVVIAALIATGIVPRC